MFVQGDSRSREKTSYKVNKHSVYNQPDFGQHLADLVRKQFLTNTGASGGFAATVSALV